MTNQLPIDMNFYNQIKSHHQAPIIDYVFAIFKNNMNMILEKGWYFWDPLAAVIASDDSLADFKVQFIKIILTPETQSGSTVVDNKTGYKIRVVSQVNKKHFEAKLLHYLSMDKP